MIVIVIVAAVFSLPLALYCPEPESLHQVGKPGLISRIRCCAATLTLGMILIFTTAALLDENLVIDPDLATLFALSRQGVFGHGFVFQVLTAGFVHIDLLHLAADLSLLALLSAYERRAGWRRFAVVYLVAALISSVGDLLWLDSQTASLGSTGGLCGLAAAYFLDVPDLTPARWFKGLLLVLFIVGVYSHIGPEVEEATALIIDPVAPIVGACAGAAYVYIFQPTPVPAGRP